MYIAFWLPALNAAVVPEQDAILHDSIVRMEGRLE
jgi:hypothetical protein